MNLSTAMARMGLDFQKLLFNAADLAYYSGAMPTSPATVTGGGNTLLVTAKFANPAFGASSESGGKLTATATFSGSEYNPAADGVANFARVKAAATAFVANSAYVQGAIVSAGSNLYLCVGSTGNAGSAAPSGTGNAITSGSTTWAYLGADGGSGFIISDLTVSAPWKAAQSVIVGQMVENGGNSYRCIAAGATAASGGPTGTGASIADGGATWAYSATPSDVSLGNALLQTGVPLTMNSFTLSTYAS